MFRIIRVLSALDKFFRPLHGHFLWDHFTYFRHGAHELYEMRAISPELQTSPKFPLRWWRMNSTLPGRDQLDEPPGPHSGTMRLLM
jgi:hypothetical protein